MKYIKTIFTLSIILATSVASESLNVTSFCYTLANTETAVASQSAFITYPGISKEGNEVQIKIYKDGSENLVHSFIISKDEMPNAETYAFALENVEAGKYRSILCLRKTDGNEICSKRSAPATTMETGKTSDDSDYELTCKRINRDSQIDLTAPLKPVSEYASDADMKILKENSATVLRRNGFSENKEVKVIDEQQTAYFAVTYPAKNFREWARKDDKCNRKYLPMIVTYIVDETTRLIVARDRMSPFMPRSFYPKYMGLQAAKDTNGALKDADSFDGVDNLPDVPVELLVNVNALKDEKKYTTWHVACMVRKEGMGDGITRCAKPFKGEFEFKKATA